MPKRAKASVQLPFTYDATGRWQPQNSTDYILKKRWPLAFVDQFGYRLVYYTLHGWQVLYNPKGKLNRYVKAVFNPLTFYDYRSYRTINGVKDDGKATR